MYFGTGTDAGHQPVSSHPRETRWRPPRLLGPLTSSHKWRGLGLVLTPAPGKGGGGIAAREEAAHLRWALPEPVCQTPRTWAEETIAQPLATCSSCKDLYGHRGHQPGSSSDSSPVYKSTTQAFCDSGQLLPCLVPQFPYLHNNSVGVLCCDDRAGGFKP